MPDEKQSTQPIMSINQSMPSSNPSGKTVLMVLGGAVVLIVVLMIYLEYFR